MKNITEWNGEGLPPVGVKCEMSYSDNEWYRCVIIAKGEEQIIYKREGCEEFSGHRNNYKFRPIRSEADKKRDAAISAIDTVCLLVRDASKTASAIYDAIAAGDIPGVKIE